MSGLHVRPDLSKLDGCLTEAIAAFASAAAQQPALFTAKLEQARLLQLQQQLEAEGRDGRELMTWNDIL